MRRVMVVALVFLLLPSGNATWTTYGGDAARSGVVDLGEGPFDVISAFAIGQDIPGNQFANLLDTPHGILGMGIGPLQGGTDNEQECTLFTLAELAASGWIPLSFAVPCMPTGSVGPNDPFGSQPIAAGYSFEQDLALLCLPTTLPGSILYAVHPDDGSVAWSIGPPWLDDDSEGTGMVGAWSCNGAAIDDQTGEAIVLFAASDGGSHRLASIRLVDGTTNWVTSMAALDLFGQNEGDSNAIAEQGAEYWGSPYNTQTAIFGVPAVVSSGIAVPVAISNDVTTVAQYQQSSAAWFDRSGTVQGKVWDVNGQSVREPDQGGTTAFAPAGWEDHVAVLVDSVVYIVQPEVDTSVPIETHHDLGGARWTVPPCWREDGLFVPLETHALILDPSGVREPVDWPGLDAGEIQQCLMTSDAEIYVVVSRDRTSGALHDLLKVDPRTGTTVAQTPLPLQGRASWLDDHLMPIDGGARLLAWDQFGHFAVLGQADDANRPGLTLADDHPGLGSPVELTVGSSPEVVGQIVAWGDGAISNLDPDEPGTHEYDEPGEYSIHVTSVFADGRTASATIPVHYGQQDLNWVQEQFSADNQDRTWGVIGIALVLLGAVIGVLARRIGRSRIAAGLRELAGIRDRSHDDALQALRELQSWHGVQEDRLLRGRLTEDQFRVLEDRGGRLMRTITQSILEPIADGLPSAFTRKLETAYRDGFVDPAEVDGLKAAASDLKLPLAKRRALDGVLDAWG